MTHTCLDELWIVHPGIVTSVIYFFSICSRVQNLLYVKNLFSFSSVLKKKCLLLLLVVLFINSVTNRSISNTLSTFNWQDFLPMEFLLLNDFLFASLKKSIVGMYNINEKNVIWKSPKGLSQKTWMVNYKSCIISLHT